MNLKRLKAFLVLARMAHLRQAAELLEQSPAALSKSMHLLEEELGYAVMVAKGRGIELTEAGRALARRLEPALAQLDGALRAEPKQASIARALPLRLSTFEIFSTHVVSRLLRGALGEMDVELRERGPGALEEDIKHRRSDIGITYLPVPTAGITFLKITDLRMAVFGRPAFAQVAWQAWPFVVPVSTVARAPTSVNALDGWPDDTKGRRIRFRVSLLETALELCRAGLAVAYLPSFLVGLHNESTLVDRRLIALPLPFRVPQAKRTVYLVTRAAAEEDAVVKQLARAVRLGVRDGERALESTIPR